MLMQTLIFKRTIIHMKCLRRKNVRFFKIYSCFRDKSNNFKEKYKDFNIEDVPSNCLTTKNAPKVLYLLSKKGAKRYASVIIEELLKNNIPVLEIQPGLGFLTRELLDAGIPKIYVYEVKDKFINALKAMSQQYPQRIHLKNYNLMQLFQLGFKDDITNEGNLEKVFSEIELQKNLDKPSLQIIGPMSNTDLLMFFTSIDPKYFVKFKHVVFYVATFPSIAEAFNEIPGNTFHKPRNIYLRLRYKHKILDEIPRKYFYPLPTFLKVKGYCRDNNKKMNIIKFELKHDDINKKFTNADWYYFLNFLRMTIKKNNTRIIPTLEKWIPGCGPNLIQCNFNIHSTFGSLTSSELLQLFQDFRALEGYESSSFISLLNSGVYNLAEHYSSSSSLPNLHTSQKKNENNVNVSQNIFKDS